MSLELVTKQSAATNVATLRALSETAGSHRTVALAALKKIGDSRAFNVPWGRSFRSFSGEAVMVEDQHAEFESAAESRFYVSNSLKELTPPGAAPLNKLVGGMRIPYGVCVLVAGTGAGKTPLAHHLASQGTESYSVVRAGEPFSGYDTAHNVLAENLGNAMLASSDIVVDSIKDLLSDGRAAMKGGVSRSALLELSAWSILGATLGCTLYVPLNPSDDDSTMIKLMASAAMSNSTMVMVHDTDSTWKYTSRRGEGLSRDSGRYNWTTEPTETRSLDSERSVVYESEDMASAFKGLLDRNRAWSSTL